MNIFAPLIRRPAGTSLLAIGLLLAGLWAYMLLGVAALPKLEFPGVFVAAQLSGANAQVMSSTVMAPLERHLGRIPGVRMLMGNASDGSAQVMVMFNFGVNVDNASREVQAAINAAEPDLPTGMPPPQYFKFDTSQIPVMLVSLTSSSLAPDKLYDLTSTVLQPAVAQIPGVARVQVFGASAHAVRIELNTAALVAKGITTNDVSNTLIAANVTSPQGILSNGRTQMTVTANDSMHDAAEFGRLVIAERHGIPVRLSDVATVSSGPEDQYQAAWFQGQRSVSMQINNRPDANAVATAEAVRARLPQLRALLPADVQITPIFDLTQSTKSALREVEVALLISIVMVALVMLVFLRRLRPTVIAMFSVPLSLAGAFVVMWIFGFTLNMLSLIALVLCVGFVVDDAIVVIENIVRHMEQGKPPLESALTGVREIGFTVVSITLSLIAVFAPMLFGNNAFTMLMREFSVTLTAAVVISAVVSLTLTPALCGRFLKLGHGSDQPAPNRLQRALERYDRGLHRTYERALDWAMHHRRIMRWQPAILLLLTAALAAAVVMTAGGGLMPDEDLGLMQAGISAEANISPTAMAARTHKVAAIMQADPAVKDVTALLGGNGGTVGNTAQLFIDLKPYGHAPGDRHLPVKQVIERLDKQYKQLADVDVSLSAVQFFPSGGGGGGNNGQGQYQFMLTSTSGSLQEPILKMAKRMRSMKQFRDVGTSFDKIGKQQTVTVDRNAAARMHVSMSMIDNALYDAFGEHTVSTIYSDTQQYSVVLTSSGAESLSPAALLNTYVRSAQGKMVPLSALARIEPSIAPVSISHYNQLESASISYNLAKGTNLLQGMNLLDKIYASTPMPAGVQKMYTGNNQQFREAATGAGLMLLAVILVLYVVLGVLYESLIHPLTILSTLPAAGMGAFLAMLVTHTQLTLMSVIAVLMLVGIVKKNAILMVDFALVAERERGLSAPAAIREAALVRFRPITMTTLVAMGAALPLVIGFGVGSEMRQPLGIAILGGLFVSQLLTLLSTPAIYLWQHDHRERKAARMQMRAEFRRRQALQQTMPALPKRG